jgi:hypothetical protein
MIKSSIFFSFVFTGFGLTTSAQKMAPFRLADAPPTPDYALEKYWSALPFREDEADVIAAGETWVSDSAKQVDVFYIYPTIYRRGEKWNADVNDEKLNQRIDRLPVRFQASAFNAVGRVYAPRYRQAIIAAFSDETGNGKTALDLAYSDVKKAFSFYLENYNNGRPVIIASHSQGTTHSRRLIKDFFDTPESRKKLLCAYIVGFAVNKADYQVLEPCPEPQAVGCYVTWASFRHGYRYRGELPYFGNVCVNPVSWKTDSLPASGRGGILLGFGKKKPYRTSARISGNLLWVKTGMPVVQTWKNKHLVDFNLFWYDIRKNAAERVEAYRKLNAK